MDFVNPVTRTTHRHTDTHTHTHTHRISNQISFGAKIPEDTEVIINIKYFTAAYYRILCFLFSGYTSRYTTLKHSIQNELIH